MATESVEHRFLPGIEDLLIRGVYDSECVQRFEEPERVAQAAENASVPLIHGVKAIGALLTSSAYNKDDPPGEETLSNLGFLLVAMGEMIASFANIRSNAEFQQATDAGKFVDVPVMGDAK